jgi:hypothetical protein
MPDKIDTWDFEDLTTALRKAIDEAYKLERTEVESLAWDGKEITTYHLLATTFGVEESLTQESLEYDQERGRDAMQVILGCAVRLGIEQGMRMLVKGFQERDHGSKARIDFIKEGINGGDSDIKVSALFFLGLLQDQVNDTHGLK